MKLDAGRVQGLEVWVLVKGFNLSYHNKGTLLLLFTIDPYYGSLNEAPLTRTQRVLLVRFLALPTPSTPRPRCAELISSVTDKELQGFEG